MTPRELKSIRAEWDRLTIVFPPFVANNFGKLLDALEEAQAKASLQDKQIDYLADALAANRLCPLCYRQDPDCEPHHVDAFCISCWAKAAELAAEAGFTVGGQEAGK